MNNLHMSKVKSTKSIVGSNSKSKTLNGTSKVLRKITNY